MGEVAVIEARDGEHSNKVQSCSDRDGRPAPADPDDAKAHQVNRNERQTTYVCRELAGVHSSRFCDFGFWLQQVLFLLRESELRI